MYHILIAANERDLAELIQLYISQYNITSDVVYSWTEVQWNIHHSIYALILLDAEYINEQTINWLNQFCPENIYPLLLVYKYKKNEMKQLSIIADYIEEPLQFRQLVKKIYLNIQKRLKIKALSQNTASIMSFKHFALNTNNQMLIIQNREIYLPNLEFALLSAFLSAPNTLLLYNNLYSSVWKQSPLEDIRTMAVHVSKLRKKIDPQNQGLITTVRGVGYIFNDL